jgi:iron-sulfur cluster insertion protein
MNNTHITITPQAQNALERFVAAHGQHVRLEINPGGCSGFDMVFAASTPRADDIQLGATGAELLIDPVSLSLINGATLDFLDQIGKEGFVVTHIPNLEASCGCGKSFSLAD